MRPLATLGDAANMNGIDWRAQLRAAEVPRRPPPSDRAGRPDRGYVEQPEEREERAVSAKPSSVMEGVVSKRGLIALADLEREQLADLADELGEPLEAPSRPPADRETRVSPLPTTQREGTDMAKSERKKRRIEPLETKLKAIARTMELDAQRRSQGMSGKTGATVQAARELGLREAVVGRWHRRWTAEHGDTPPPADTKTMTSAPRGAPSERMSAPVSSVHVSNGALPPVPTVSIPGLEEYIRAIVAQEISLALRRGFGVG